MVNREISKMNEFLYFRLGEYEEHNAVRQPTATDSCSFGDWEHPIIDLALGYDFMRGLLTVYLYQLRNVTDAASTIRIIAGQSMLLSKVAKLRNNHTFMEAVEVWRIPLQSIYRHSVNVQVYVHDVTLSKSRFLGSAIMHLRYADLYGERISLPIDTNNREIMKLESCSKGEVEIELGIDGSRRSILGSLKRAVHLQLAKPLGFLDIYGKIKLYSDGRLLKKWKSTGKKSLSPVFNENFSFDIEVDDESDVSLTITLEARNRLGQKKTIGMAVLENCLCRVYSLPMSSEGHGVVKSWHTLFERSASKAPSTSMNNVRFQLP